MAALPERLTDSLYGLGWTGVKRLPQPAAAALGRRVADTAWKRRGDGVRRLEANLARVVPEASPQRLAELSRLGMRSYLRYWMESFRLPTLSGDAVGRVFQPGGLQHLTDAMAAGKGAILLLPHLANWDLAGAWVTTQLGLPFTTVAERLRPESLYDRFVAYRESLGMEVLPHSGGSAFGVLARRLRTGSLVVPCRRPRPVLLRSGGLLLRGDAPGCRRAPPCSPWPPVPRMLPVTLWYDEPPVMRGRVHPPVEVPEAGDRRAKASVMTQAMADVFASGIAQHPEDWHMLQRLWTADLAAARPRPGVRG